MKIQSNIETKVVDVKGSRKVWAAMRIIRGEDVGLIPCVYLSKDKAKLAARKEYASKFSVLGRRVTNYRIMAIAVE